MPKIKYEVVEGLDINEFEKEISDKLNNGFKLAGDLQVVVFTTVYEYSGKEDEVRLYQSLISVF